MTPDVMAIFIQNKPLSASARAQLDQVIKKKQDIAANNGAILAAKNSIDAITQDESRIRSNIQSLSAVAGQQDLVQQYARQLSANETKLGTLRASLDDLNAKKTTLESELAALMDKIEF
jgi:chromosome segregation ATPase